MGRTARINLALAAVVAALAWIVYREVREEIDAREPPLAALDPASIDRVAVRCISCVTRVFARRNDRWRMLEPYALDADDGAVARLIAIGSAPVRTRRPAHEFEPHRIGLEPPQTTLELGALTLEIGLTDALRGDRYVRVGDIIAMVPDRFSQLLMATPESELDRRLLPRDVTVHAVRIDGVNRPDVLAAWNHAVALRVATATPEADAAATIRVDLDLANGEDITFRLRRVVDGYIALREQPPLAYVLDEARMQALTAAASVD